MTEQTLTIRGWHPPQELNAGHSHWAVVAKHRDQTKRLVWLSARGAEWVFFPGRVRLEVTLVYPRRYEADPDNLHARCKALLDALKGEFFSDDRGSVLDLVVTTAVQRKTKETRLRLVALDAKGSVS